MARQFPAALPDDHFGSASGEPLFFAAGACVNLPPTGNAAILKSAR